MITFNKSPGQRILELGAGDKRHPDADVAVDIRPAPHIDFTCDLEEPLPITDKDFDCVFCTYVLEHVTWRKVPQLLKEVFRILKPGGKFVAVTSNTEKQLEFVKNNPEGWDGKDSFESFSCVLFGDCDYPHNTHKSFFSPLILGDLFQKAGFRDIVISPAGARETDLTVEAARPLGEQYGKSLVLEAEPYVDPQLVMPREEQFDKHYFNGGGKVGGYAREGYWDFPCHTITARHVLSRKPESVLELGAARGYVLKRIQDSGVRGCGLEISEHCWLTRACDGIIRKDVCDGTPWPYKDKEFDLCFSQAFLEHIPEQHLKHVISEMARTAHRGLHGVDFGDRDDGFDKTHVSLRRFAFWVDKFAEHAPKWPVEILDKEELEKGDFPVEVLHGDGRRKLNLGSFSVMFHNGWDNLDVADLVQFAKAYGYDYKKHDVRNGLPYETGAVDLIYTSHLLEHLTYQEGLALLGECRRVIRPDGLLRIAVPDAELLNRLYTYSNDGVVALSQFDEVNDGCERAETQAGKLWSLLHEGHSSCYDAETLAHALTIAGFQPQKSSFRMKDDRTSGERHSQMLRETTEGFPCLSLFYNATPDTGR